MQLRSGLLPFVRELAVMSCEETCMGKVEDKITKIELAINQTPATEELTTTVKTGGRRNDIFLIILHLVLLVLYIQVQIHVKP